MSEADKHSGDEATDLDRAGDDRGTLGRATEALKDARDGAAHAAERLRDRVSERYDRAQDWAHDSYETLSRNATYARRRTAVELGRSRRGVEAFVEQNPIMVGVAGLAAGLLIGALLPSTRRENEWLGPYADDLRREGARQAKDMAERGREALSDDLRAMMQPRDREPR